MSIKLSQVPNPFFKSLPTIELFVELLSPPSFSTSIITLVPEESKAELVEILEVQKVLP